ncbi:hypothetical protein AALP_AA8G456000 [Arabis alpina]|uniref:F-box domain-containing protein n=1 Tax=Arabis alpina TaxID=50452 RepID=A0A087GDM5_ARAAL|nr:hypothetical protein AALP_AA8G456000 [Arabis alpina]
MGMSLALLSSLQWRKKKRSLKSTRRVKGRKRLRRGDDMVAPEIPLELQMEILTRLPSKSLMRFKCVSKLWFSLIRSRYFTNRHLTVGPPPPRPPPLYMSLVNHFECDSMEVCHNPGESLLLSLSPSSSSAKCLDRDLILPGLGGVNMVALRGLLLYIVCREACIYNPTTRQSLTLPSIKSNIFAPDEICKYVLYFLGYDPVLDQYKVLCTFAMYSRDLQWITTEHWVFVLEAGGCWRRFEFDQYQPHLPTRLGLCINGVIYYLASTCMSRSIVIRFDVRSEEFLMIQAPDDVSGVFMVTGFIEYAGRPAILDHTRFRNKGMVDLWVLEDGGKWTMKSLVLRSSQMHLIDNNISWAVQGTTRNGEVIFSRFDLLPPYYILYYDLQKNDLRRVKIRGIPDHWFSRLDPKPYFYFKLLDNSENIMHLEA